MENHRPPNNKALAILRISSAGQEDGYSHDLQEQEVKAYATREKFDLVEVVRIVESAKDHKDRRKYHAAITRVLDDNIGNLLFYQQDREARNSSDLEQNERYVMEGKFFLHYVRDRRTLHKHSPESDFLSRDFQGLVHKQYSRNLRVKVLDGMRQKAKSGWFPSNHVPLGYVLKPSIDENGQIKKRGGTIGVDPNPAVTTLVVREFELRAKGLSIDAIRDEVLAENLVPASRLKTYCRNSIEDRLRNPFYRGQFIWRGEEYRGKHDVFIPQETMAAVDRSFGVRGFKPRSDGQGLFTGWIRCSHSECGCLVTFDPKIKVLQSGERRLHKYYRCCNGKRLHKSMKGMSVKEEFLFDQFSGAVDSIAVEADFAKQVAEALNYLHRRSRRALEHEILAEQDKSGLIDAKIAELTEWRIDGRIEAETYRITHQKFMHDKAQASERLRVLSLQIHDAGMETAKSTIELATKAKSLWLSRSTQERRAFLDLILSNPLWDGATLRYELKKPFKVLKEMRGNSEWRTQLGNFRTACAEAA